MHTQSFALSRTLTLPLPLLLHSLLRRIRHEDDGGGGAIASRHGEGHVALRRIGDVLLWWDRIEDRSSEFGLLWLLLLLFRFKRRHLGAASSLLHGQGEVSPLDSKEFLPDGLKE